ncbi:MAG: DMT family transporter [Bacteroidetes bacterium]|nr:DMT family transporter [Bacteroidota bacterium]
MRSHRSEIPASPITQTYNSILITLAIVNRTFLAHLSLFTAMAIYAAGFTIIKEVTPSHISPIGFVVLRLLGATPLLWLTGMIVGEKMARKDILKCALLSLFGVSINQSLFVKGMSLTSPISGAIIMITSPLLVLILGNIILKEKITWQRLTGIIVGLGGAVFLVMMNLRNTVSAKADSPVGDIFIFINAISWGIFLVLVKPMMQKYHTITILKWVFLFGMVIIVPLGTSDVMKVNWHEVDGHTWFNICFVVFAVTYFAYILNTLALKALSPTVVSAYIYLQPVLAAAIALYLGKDVLSWQKIVSALMIFSGVTLASQNKKSAAAQ